MENKRKLTDEEISEIEMLVSRALNASNKKSANAYINRLDFM